MKINVQRKIYIARRNSSLRNLGFYSLSTIIENVNPNDTPINRKISMLKVIDDVLLIIGEKNDTKENIRMFLLHVAWHEGLKLTTRTQDKDVVGDEKGPARSFYQFEAHRARDDYMQAVKGFKQRLSALVGVSKQTEIKLNDEFEKLPDKGSYYPKDNLIEELMLSNDAFASCLIRFSIMRFPEKVPDSNIGHADYWFKYWKKSDPEPEKVKKAFLDAAKEVDKI